MDINYTVLRTLKLKATCYDNDWVIVQHYMFHLALVYDHLESGYYYLLEYSDSSEKWYILHDGINKEWLLDKFNERAAEIHEDLAGLIDL